jgi:hypothetical protein
MPYDYTGAGAPGANGVVAPGATSAADYLDTVNGVQYTLSKQGWQPMLESVQDAITAHAGGGQGSAVLITAQNARVTVVGTAADSVVLPPSVPGLIITISNAAAVNSLNVFPPVGSSIDNGAANAASAVAALKTATFTCYSATQWHKLLSA